MPRFPPKQKRQRFLFSAGFIVIVLLVLWFLSRKAASDDPVFQGKHLSTWFDQMPSAPGYGSPQTGCFLEFAPTNRNPFIVFQSFDSNAAPFLIAKLNQADRSQSSSWLREMSYRLRTRNWRVITGQIRIGRWPVSNGSVREQRFAAIHALAQMGPKAEPAVPSLIDSLNVPGLDYAAVYALGRMGPAAAPAVPRLCEMLQKESATAEILRHSWRGGASHLRPLILTTLGQIGSPARQAASQLEEELQNYSARTNSIATSTDSSDAQTRTARQKQIDVLLDVEKQNRLLTAIALWRINPSKENIILPVLSELLQGEEFYDDAVAVGFLGPRPKVPRSNIGEGGRSMAAKYLAQIASPAAIRVLQTVAIHEQDKAMRETIEAALREPQPNPEMNP